MRGAFKIKIKGGALYIAVIIGIITGLLLLMLILLSRYNQRTVTQLCQSSQLQFNLKSALEIARSDYFGEQHNNKWLKNEFNDDSIKIEKFYWGAYVVINAVTKNRHERLSTSGLYGTFASSDTGLLITENTMPTGLSGKIVFKANCYFPSAGVRGANIEGQSYLNSPENAGHIKKAPQRIPELSNEFVKSVNERELQLNDSMVTDVSPLNKNSFNNKTLCCILNSGILRGLDLKGNIKLICNGYLKIEDDCTLDNILIVCKGIRFRKGFKGSVHVIASDSIVTEENCHFEYPSSFILSPHNNSTSISTIFVGEKNNFYGGIYAFDKTENVNHYLLVKVSNGTCVKGLIYSSDHADVQGKINGTVISSALVVKTPSAVYENHLQNCEIDPSPISHILFIPPAWEKSKLLLCKELL